MQSKFPNSPNSTHTHPVFKLMFFHLLFASYAATVKEAELLWMLLCLFWVSAEMCQAISSQACIFDCLVQCPHTSLLICFQCVWSSMDVLWNHISKEMRAHMMCSVYKTEVWGLPLVTNVNVSSSSFHPEQAALLVHYFPSTFSLGKKIFLFWCLWVLFLPLPHSAVQSFQRTDSLKYHIQWWVHRWLWGHPTFSVYLLVQHYTNRNKFIWRILLDVTFPCSKEQQLLLEQVISLWRE